MQRAPLHTRINQKHCLQSINGPPYIFETKFVHQRHPYVLEQIKELWFQQIEGSPFLHFRLKTWVCLETQVRPLRACYFNYVVEQTKGPLTLVLQLRLP